MSCALTLGYTLGCRDAVGGIKEIRVASYNPTGSIATNGSGVVTAFTGYASGTAGSNAFYRYELTKNTSMLSEALTSSVENGTIFYDQQATFVINKLQVQVRNQLMFMARSRVVAIVTDYNNNHYMIGIENGADISAATADTGTAFGDRSGYSTTIQGQERFPMYAITGSILAGITASGVMAAATSGGGL
jgi:hypothetical protein